VTDGTHASVHQYDKNVVNELFVKHLKNSGKTDKSVGRKADTVLGHRYEKPGVRVAAGQKESRLESVQRRVIR